MIELSEILSRLKVLVASDTRNPPRNIRASDSVIEFLAAELQGFRISVEDHGNGSLGLLAVRGTPDIIFNFHLDTVPAADNWHSDPFELVVSNGRATGLGACDTKGALACMLAVAAQAPEHLAILVTTDEEAGVAQAVSAFLRSDHGFRSAIVAEPTGCKAVIAHRGIISARAVFAGIAGHASSERVAHDSAVHRAVNWAAASLVHAQSWQQKQQDELRGVPFNIGRIDGGIKPNMIAASCEVRFGIRTLPGQDGESLLTELRDLASSEHLVEWETTFSAPSLPADGSHGSRTLVEKLGLEPGPAVGFWSEAALFSAAGLDALVLGSGDIAQAHTADEWVALADLERLASIYAQLVNCGNQ